MFCIKCGKELDSGARFCSECGAPTASDITPQVVNSYSSVKTDKGNIGWGVLGFFFPLVGLILFLVWKDTKPGDSSMAGKGALLSVIISFGLSILWTIIAFIITIFAAGFGLLLI